MPTSREPDILIIGYGKTLRRDDGVGPHIAQILESWEHPRLRTHIAHQLTPELAEPISQTDVVVFVDACRESETEYEMREVSPGLDRGPSFHSARPEALVALALELFGHAPQAWLLTVKGEDFSLGEGLNVETQRRAVAAIELLAGELLE
ncbi:MAG: hydrogenase maturation protease [Gemmataceae bacterium]